MRTMEVLTNIAAGTVVLTFMGGIFTYVVLNPLNAAILTLQATVDKLTESVKANEARWHSSEVKLTEVDQRSKSAHRRLDHLEEVLR
jgi:hypothetical protein